MLPAGVVHEPIDAAVGAEHRVDRRDHHRFIPDIANLREDLSAVLFDLGLHLRKLFGPATENRDVGAKGHKLVCGATTNAAATARDDNCLAFEEIRPEDRLI